MSDLSITVDNVKLDREHRKDKHNVEYKDLKRIINNPRTHIFWTEGPLEGLERGIYCMHVYSNKLGHNSIRFIAEPSDNESELSLFEVCSYDLVDNVLAVDYVRGRLREGDLGDSVKYSRFPEIDEYTSKLPKSERFLLYLALFNELNDSSNASFGEMVKMIVKMVWTRNAFDYGLLEKYARSNYLAVNSAQLKGDRLTLDLKD